MVPSDFETFYLSNQLDTFVGDDGAKQMYMDMSTKILFLEWAEMTI